MLCSISLNGRENALLISRNHNADQIIGNENVWCYSLCLSEGGRGEGLRQESTPGDCCSRGPCGVCAEARLREGAWPKTKLGAWPKTAGGVAEGKAGAPWGGGWLDPEQQHCRGWKDGIPSAHFQRTCNILDCRGITVPRARV